MEGLDRPWTGLAAVAPRRNLWLVLEALGGAARAPSANGEAWCAAGLTLVEAARAVGGRRWPGRGLCAADPAWPERLVGVPFGPVAFALEGDAELLDRRAVAIVGARACTSYGRTWARRLAAGVADAGGVVVSGLAAGIDTEAHLAAPGATIAVLGQGLATRMPAAAARARERILGDGGLVVSEFPPEQVPDTWTFPVRNRVVAALADAVVVVEAGARSGARITAARGLDANREVLAVPGPLGAPASEGCLALLDDGASVVLGVETVLKAAKLPGRSKGAASGVLGALGEGATEEEVIARTGLSRAVVAEAIGTLVLTGRVTRLPGRRYVPR